MPTVPSLSKSGGPPGSLPQAASNASRSRIPTLPSSSKSAGQCVAYGGGKQVPQGLPPASEHHSASSFARSNASTQPSGTLAAPEMSATARFAGVSATAVPQSVGAYYMQESSPLQCGSLIHTDRELHVRACSGIPRTRCSTCTLPSSRIRTT